MCMVQFDIFLNGRYVIGLCRHKVRAIIISRRVLICSDGYIYFLLSCCDTCLLVRVVTDKITFVLFCRIINFFLRNKTGSFTFELSVFYIAFFIQGCRRYQHIQSDGIVTILSVDLAMECFRTDLDGDITGNNSVCFFILFFSDTIDTRPQDPYEISEDDREELRRVILPYWEGKSMEEYCMYHMLTIIGR